jgi:hypothetical protein
MKRRVVAPLLALALGLGLLIAAWVLLLPATITLVAPSFAIATRIHDAHSALVRTVSYRLSLIGTGEVRVYLIPGATKAQAKALWCDVVVPAAGDLLEHVEVAILSSDPPKAGVNALLASRGVVCTD